MEASAINKGGGGHIDERDTLESAVQLLTGAKDIIDIEAVLQWLNSQGQRLEIKLTGQQFKPKYYFIGPAPGGFTLWYAKEDGSPAALNSADFLTSLKLSNNV